MIATTGEGDTMTGVDAVTGAFGYTGSFIAEQLLSEGRTVRTLTRRQPDGHRLEGRVEALPLRFDDAEALASALRGVDTLYNTFWRRFPNPATGGFEDILAQTATLLRAASTAGVRRVVQFSVASASDRAPTSYFRAKAQVERIARASGLSCAILRPTLLYGPGDILVNNLAWTLRRVPLFGMPGNGAYRVNPVLVTDLAALAIRLGRSDESVTVDGAGPDTYAFRDLVHIIRDRIRAPARIIGVPPLVALTASRVIGRFTGDVVLIRDEITELMAGLLVSDDPATCPTGFDEWLVANASSVGRRYSSEVARNYEPRP